jgi:hypothetical protein
MGQLKSHHLQGNPTLVGTEKDNQVLLLWIVGVQRTRAVLNDVPRPIVADPVP